MKKLYFLFHLLFSINIINANPISLIEHKVSEIYFNESGEWVIEFHSSYKDLYLSGNLDSIKIETTAGTAKVLTIDTSFGYLPVFKRSDLDNPIPISKEADKIMISFFTNNKGETKIESANIALGNHPESYLHNIEYGQSIATSATFEYFFKSEPNLGYYGELDYAIMGHINGHFYDIGGNLIKDRCFLIDLNPFKIEIDSNGFFSARILANKYSLSKVRLTYPNYCYEWEKYYETEQQNTTINGNDTINIDFRLSEQLLSIKNIDKQTTLLNNHPNPAKDYTYFIFESMLQRKNTFIHIYDINGRLVDSFIPDSSTHYFDCCHLAQGMYIYTLSVNNEVVSKNKLIISR